MLVIIINGGVIEAVLSVCMLHVLYYFDSLTLDVRLIMMCEPIEVQRFTGITY